MIKNNLYKITTALCALLLVAATVFVLIRWSHLPDEIPIHYNFAGEVDDYGGKGSLILMIVLAWVVFFTMTICIKYPDKWNMPVKVTEENKSRLYAITRAMMEVMKVLTSLLFVMMFVSIAAGISLPPWPVITMIAAILLTVVVGFIMLYKNK